MDSQSKFDKFFADISRIQEELRLVAKKKLNTESSPGVDDEDFDYGDGDWSSFDSYNYGIDDGEIILAREFFDKLEAITFAIESGTYE